MNEAWGEVLQKQIDQRQSSIKRKPGESNESLARRLYWAERRAEAVFTRQVLVVDESFEFLSFELRSRYIEMAKQRP